MKESLKKAGGLFLVVTLACATGLLIANWASAKMNAPKPTPAS